VAATYRSSLQLGAHFYRVETLFTSGSKLGKSSNYAGRSDCGIWESMEGRPSEREHQFKHMLDAPLNAHLSELRHWFHQHPELSFQEAETAKRKRIYGCVIRVRECRGHACLRTLQPHGDVAGSGPFIQPKSAARACTTGFSTGRGKRRWGTGRDQGRRIG